MAAMLEALRLADVAPHQLFSVALGTPGVVDATHGTVPSIPGWTSLPLVDELRGTFAGPIFIENDVNLSVLAEQRHTGAAATDTLVFIQRGVRIGAGIMIGGHLHRGRSSPAREVGFIDLAETPTPAGILGAFEQTVGSAAIVELAARQTATKHLLDASAVLAAATDGHRAALEVIDAIAARFARGIAHPG